MEAIGGYFEESEIYRHLSSFLNISSLFLDLSVGLYVCLYVILNVYSELSGIKLCQI